MQKILKQVPLGLLSVILIGGFIASCEKEGNVVGLDQVSGDIPNLSSFDSLQVVTYTEADDSIRTDGATFSMVGSYVDPFVGRADSWFYTELRLESLSPNFGTNVFIDSVVFTLSYAGWYGDTLNQMTLRVHEVDEEIVGNSDDELYSNKDFNVTNEIGSLTFSPRPSQRKDIDGDTVAYPLSITLDSNYFRTKIIEAASADLSSNDAFRDYFKGIRVKSDGDDASILSFNTRISASGITIHYHNDTEDSLTYNLLINSNSEQFNHFEQDYSTAVFDLSTQDTVNGETQVYTQAMGGLLTIIEFPQLKDLIEKGLIINKAELIMPIDPAGTDSRYPPSERLLLVQLEDDDNKIVLADIFEGDAHFGGFYNEDKEQYTFNITRHIQNIFNRNNENSRLALLPTGSAINASRAILRGGNAPTDRMKLKIYFTKP